MRRSSAVTSRVRAHFGQMVSMDSSRVASGPSMAASREVRIEPREAQRGARMSAGAECESRIERHDDGTGSADALVTRTYPEPVTEAHRMKVLEPLALPDAVGHRPHLDAHRVEPERGAERARDGRRIALAGEQAPQARPRPETKLPGGGLEHRGPHETRRLVERRGVRLARWAGFRGVVDRGPHEIRRLVERRGVRLARWAGFRGVVYGIIARVDEGQRARAARPAGPFRSLAVHRPEIERELEIHGRIMRRHRNRTRRAGLTRGAAARAWVSAVPDAARGNGCRCRPSGMPRGCRSPDAAPRWS